MYCIPSSIHNPIRFGTNDYDYNKEKDYLQNLRIAALEETINTFGIDTIVNLAQNVSELSFLIDSLINSKYFDDVDFKFIMKTCLTVPEFAERLIKSIYHLKGIAHFANGFEGLSSDDSKWIVCQLPITPDVVEYVNTFSEDIQNEFWQSADTFGIMHYDYSFVHNCISMLLK